MKMAMFGGSYNPIHVGHLICVDEILTEFKIDKAILVPAWKPPHKQIVSGIDAETRLEMLQNATYQDNRFIIELCEIKRGGTSYTIDTVKYLYDHYDIDDKLFLVIGDDLIEGFHTWKNVHEIESMCNIIIAHRLFPEEKSFPFAHRYAHNLQVPISSSFIRNQISQNLAWNYLVPSAVSSIIKGKFLYGYQTDNS